MICLNSLRNPARGVVQSLIFICLVCSFSGCSVSQTGRQNIAFGMTNGNIITYAGMAMLPQPAFSVFQLSSSLPVDTSFSDSVQLEVDTNASCTQASTGTLAATSNPLPLSQGVAQFAGVTLTPPSGVYEQLVYLKASLVTEGTSYCSLPVSVIQHFNLGFGYVGFGLPGAAGANTSASVLDAGVMHRFDSNGLYVVAGNSKNGSGQEVALWRYLPNGMLDTSFKNAQSNVSGSIHYGSTGVAGASGASENDSVVDLRIDSSGRYIVLATSINNTNTGRELALLRYTSSGVLDTTFGTAGIYHTGSPGLTGMSPASAVNDQPKAMVLDSQQRIIVVGRSQNASGYSLLLARFTANGALDTSFASSGSYNDGGAAGVAGGAAGSTKNDVGYAVQIDSQGNIIIAGSSDTNSSQQQLAIWRFNSRGSLDSSFGNAGVVLSGLTGAAGGTGANLSDIGRALALDSANSNGSYVISGSSKNSSGGIEMTLWRYLSSGSLDSTFGTSGYAHYGASGGAAGAATANDSGSSLAIDSVNQRYVVAGPSLNASSRTQVAVWRTGFSGSLDSLFNTQGYVTTPATGASGAMSAANVYDFPGSIQVDAVGTYSVVGTSKISPAAAGQELAIWRYLPVGILDL